MARPVPGLDELTEHTFTPDRTRRVLEHVAWLTDLDPTDAVLLRHQTNAVYRLTSAPVVVKIARPDIRHARDVVALVQWLVDHHIPTVPPVAALKQPIKLAGCAVTLWHYLPQDHLITAGDIAEPLRALHTAPPPPLTLPELDPIGAIRRAITASRILTDTERAALSRRCNELAEPYAALRYDSASCLIHADPQHRNTLWDRACSQAVLCDWDSAALGHPEWDLVTIEVHCRRFAHPEREYRDFRERYDRDIRDWAGFSVLRDVRELRMIATNAGKSHPGTPQAAEVHHRVSELTNGHRHAWNIL